MTPKCYLFKVLPAKEKLPSNIIFQQDSSIYLNKENGWTEEECDSVVYFIDRDEMNKQSSDMILTLEKG